MKRAITSAILLALLTGLFIIPQIGSNITQANQIPQEDIDPLVETYYPAAEGDPSSASITSFHETTADDVRYSPDSYNVVISAYAGKDEEGDTLTVYSGAVSDVQLDDSDYMWVYGYMADSGSYIHINWTFIGDCSYTPKLNAVKTKFTPLASASAPPDPQQSTQYIDFAESYIYNWSSDAFVLCANDTAANPITFDYSVRGDNQTDFQSSNGTVIAYTRIKAKYHLDNINYVSCKMFYGVIEREGGYAGYTESFADVSDWTNHNGISLTTDGDVATWTIAGDGSSKNFYTNAISLAVGAGDYFEFYIKTNHTVDNQVNGWVYGYTADDKGGDPILIQPTRTYLKNAWQSKKYHVNNAGTIESMMFYFRAQTGGADVEIYFDFFRMDDSTEFGWQHDCSTLAGVTDGGGGSSSSDGDELTLTADSDGSAFEFAIDTTATGAYLDADYYPMISLDFNDADSADYVKVESYDGSAWATVIANTTIGTSTHYANCKAADADIEKFRISVNPSANPRLDSFKAFSIANFTLTQSVSCSVSDVTYVDDSSRLVFDKDTAHYIGVAHDPTLSVAIATYNVWNCTLVSPSAANYIQFYVGASWETHYFSNTRGSFTGTGTLTDLVFVIYYDETVSAIKFWEDSVAPTIGSTWATPYSPTDDDDITLSVYTADWTDLCSVTLNAIDCPATFNDVDYDCSKNSEDSDLWTYTFDSADIPNGYYAIVATANDGANTVTDLIIFRVGAIVLQITDIVLITATQDLAQISGYINKGASYNIYENDSSVGSGSVSIGWFSISWAKDATAGTYIELGILFTSGDYTEWVNGSYSVASAEVLSIVNTVYTGNDASNTLSGHANLDCDYYIYENDSQVETGALGAGSFSLNWDRNSTDGLISWGAKFTDGTTVRWVNGTYYNTPSIYDDLMLSAVSFTAGTEEIAVFIQTNWNNCTIHL